MYGDLDDGKHTTFNMFRINGKYRDDLKIYPEKIPSDFYYYLNIVPYFFNDMVAK